MDPANSGGMTPNSAPYGQDASYSIGQSHIPFIFCSSGSMGNNGAITGLMALPNTYASAYIYMPAGAISSGSAAGWYYFVGSSATAGTVFNNLYTSGTPQIPASPTAFVTTGPGAFTQTTAAFIAGYTLAIPANTIGLNGTIRVSGMVSYNNSAGAKSYQLSYGGAALGSGVPTADTNSGFVAGFSNRGVTNSQVPLTSFSLAGTAGTTGPNYPAIDSTAAQPLAINLKLATATDFVALESILVELLPGVP